MKKRLVAATVMFAVLFGTIMRAEAGTAMNSGTMSISNGYGLRLNAAGSGKAKVASISLGNRYSGAVTEDGDLYMWGMNGNGQLGNGAEAGFYLRGPENKPVKVLENVESVSLAQNHSGAVTKDGTLYMWGDNKYVQLGCLKIKGNCLQCSD